MAECHRRHAASVRSRESAAYRDMTRRFYFGSIVGTLAAVIIILEFGPRLVPIPAALLRPAVQSISLLDRNGVPLREARVSERFSRELALDELPRNVIDAIVAAEDKRFYSHHGIDWLATRRAGVTGFSTRRA